MSHERHHLVEHNAEMKLVLQKYNFSALPSELYVRRQIIPAAVFIAAFAPELVGRENSENAFFRAEILPFDSWVGLQIIGKN